MEHQVPLNVGKGGLSKRQKKTSLACLSCQKSHYPCDEGRPCQSCLKRGKGDTCRDGVKKKAKYLEAAAEIPVGNLPPPPPPPSKGMPMYNTAGAPLQVRAGNGILSQPKVQSSSDNLLILAHGANLEHVPVGEPPAVYQSQVLSTRMPMPTHTATNLSQEATAMMGIRPYDYARSYHHILDYLQVRLKPENLVKVCKSLIRVRTCLIALLKGLHSSDLIFMEHCFQRSLPGVSKVLSMVALPSCVWRRTGEIVYSNKELFMITGWSREMLCDGRRMIFEVLDEPGIITYWERYSELGTEPSTSSFCFPCALKRPDGHWIQGALWVSIRRDIYNLPIVLVGNFLPNLWRADVPSAANTLPSIHSSTMSAIGGGGKAGMASTLGNNVISPTASLHSGSGSGSRSSNLS